MTRLQLYEHALVECNKNQAPPLLIDDYNYLIMKAIYNYIAKSYRYNEISQELDDNLRVLRVPYVIKTNKEITTYGKSKKVYQFNLPEDYMHLLNCIVAYTYNKDYGCNKKGDEITYGCIRMTTQMQPVFSWNYYIVPKWNKPYALLNSLQDAKKVNDPNTDDEASVDGETNENKTPACIDVHIGNKPSYLDITAVHGWYFKVPENVKLTQDDLDSDEDNTPFLEFPDYVCYNIIKELVALILEHDSNPRLQTNLGINMTGQEQQK